MKQFDKLFLATLGLGLFAGEARAQMSVGNGASAPRAGVVLDVNGPIAAAEATVAATGTTTPTAAITGNVGQVQLTAGTASAGSTIAVTYGNTPQAGQRLIIYNNSGLAATFNNQNIPTAQTVEFVYSNNGWRASGDGGSSVVANNGLTKTANLVQLGGALNQATTINTAGNALNVSGTGPLTVAGATTVNNNLSVVNGNLVVNTSNSTTSLLTVTTGPVFNATNANGVYAFYDVPNNGYQVMGDNTIPDETGTRNLGVAGYRWATIYGVNQNLTGGFTYTPNNTAPAAGSVLTSNAAGLASWSTPASIANSGGAATIANNGLSLSANTVQLGGVLTKATIIGASNFGLSVTGTNNTSTTFGTGGGLIMDATQANTGSTGVQRLEFTSYGDPNAAIGHTAFGSETSDLYLYSGNDNQAAYGPDRIRLVGENVLFQSFNNANNSSLANAETNTNTITNMFIGANGNVGIGTVTPGATLSIKSNTTSAPTLNVLTANGTIPAINTASNYAYYDIAGTEYHQFGGHVVPDADNNLTLGTSTARWATIYGVNGLYSGTMGVTGATTLGNTLSVTGATTLSNTLAVTGAATLNSTLAVTGATTLNNTLGVTGAATLNSTLAVTGATTLNNTLATTGATTLKSTLAVTDRATFNNGISIASTGQPTMTITSTSSALNGIAANTAGTFYYEATGTETHMFGGNVVPDNDGGRTLGASTNRWGTIYSSNGTIQTSDKRLKTHIANTTYGLKDVLKMRPVTYNWKTDPSANRMVGFIAQEMEQIVPEAVETPKTAAEHYGMKYNELIPVLTKAIQEQQAEIEALKAANAKLQAQAASTSQAQAELQDVKASLQSLSEVVKQLQAGAATASSK